MTTNTKLLGTALALGLAGAAVVGGTAVASAATPTEQGGATSGITDSTGGPIDLSSTDDIAIWKDADGSVHAKQWSDD